MDCVAIVWLVVEDTSPHLLFLVHNNVSFNQFLYVLSVHMFIWTSLVELLHQFFRISLLMFGAFLLKKRE